MTRHSFLIYANRSGSTLLSAQLSKRIDPDRLLVIPEFRLIEFLFELGDVKARQLKPSSMRSMVADDRQITANLGLRPEELMAVLRPTVGGGIAAKLEAILRAYMRRNSLPGEPEVVMWKWGDAATYVYAIKPVFPDARFVHVIRDGRGVVNSLLTTESPYFPGENLARGSTLYGAHHWKSSLRRNTRPRQAGLDLIDVRYHDLVRAPEEVCRVVGRFLGLEAEPVGEPAEPTFRVSTTEQGIHPLVNESPVSERIAGWERELDPWRRYVVEHTAGPELEALGYEIGPTRVSRVKRIAWLTRAEIERFLGYSSWMLRRLRRYGARLVMRLLRLRVRAWLATRRTLGDS
jgi:hypothetical protein